MRAILRSSAAAAPAEAMSPAARAKNLRRKLMGAPLEPFGGDPPPAAARGLAPLEPGRSRSLKLSLRSIEGASAGALLPQPRRGPRERALAPRPPRPYKACS